MDDEPVKKSKTRKLVNIISMSYVVSVITYLAGLYFIIQGYLLGFIGAIPTLILGLNLLYKGERRYGWVLVGFFFVWIIIYYDYLTGNY